jgi:hypothetical protein
VLQRRAHRLPAVSSTAGRKSISGSRPRFSLGRRVNASGLPNRTLLSSSPSRPPVCRTGG